MALVGRPRPATRSDAHRRPLPSAAARPTEPPEDPHGLTTQFLHGAGAVSAARPPPSAAWRWPRCPSPSSRPGPTPCRRCCRPTATLPAGGHAQRLDAALAHEPGVKEFHLVAEPVVREMAPGFKAHLWGYNGQSPGPTIEVVEGDRVRLFVTNRLPRAHQRALARPAPAQRHGRRDRPQPARHPPGKTFVYEFVARRPGTFMYHPHADEMVQMAMGMMGFWVTHPKLEAPADRRGRPRLLLLAERLRHRPGSYTPKIMTMLDFNLWSWNSRHLPRHRPAERAPDGRPGAHPHRQPDDDQPPDPPARP
jgi:FtsP/CotA-like multicopper oxidase with cupredoxin domain